MNVNFESKVYSFEVKPGHEVRLPISAMVRQSLQGTLSSPFTAFHTRVILSICFHHQCPLIYEHTLFPTLYFPSQIESPWFITCLPG